LFCYHGDAPQKETNNQSLTNFLVYGTSYLPWACAIKIALGGKLKLEHIMGTISTAEAQPIVKSPEYIASDLFVMSWIFNFMEHNIYSIFAYSNTTKELWDSLFRMYGNSNNSSKIFEIQHNLSALR
jgi:hypothetical protein